jgi:hypothetical protein
LNAQNNININTSLYGTGTASLALLYGQDAINAGITSNYYLNNGAEINLSAGQNFSTQLGTDVAPTAYTVITTLGSANSGATTDLQGIQNNLSGNYVLGANINASATSSWNGGGGFTPLGNQTTDFSGTFDGLGHSISNLHINQPSNFGIGLFGYTDPVAVISNTRLLAVNVNGEADVGGLAGYNGGSIFNSFATGTITGSLFVGGLAGANNGAINNSFATASVSGTSFVGGLTGDNSNSINNSYASGSVSGSNAVGGLVGDNDESIVNTVSITNSLSTATVNGATSVGGLVGYNGDGTISGSFWNTDTSGQGSSDGGIGLTSAQMMNPANFTSATSANGNVNPGWDLTNTWTIPAGGTAPVLGALPAQAFSPAENIEAGAPDLPPNQVTTVTTQLVNSVAIPASIPNTTPSDPSAKPLNLSSSTTNTTTVNGVDLKIINGGIKGATEVTNDPL